MAPASVIFTLKILSSTSCLLYQEDQNLNLASSNGKFSIGVGSVVGSVKRTAGIDPGNSMTTVFRNSGSIPGYGCTYNPSVGDRRSLVVTVDDGVTVETLSAQTINSVPTAYLAENAEAVGGYTSADLLKVNIAASQVLSQSNLENIFTSANYSSLTSLLAGSSTLYNKPAANGTTVVPAIASPSSPAAGQIWYNAGDILYYDGSATRTISTGGTGVTTFNGRTGAVTSATNDYTWAQIDKTTSSLADLTTRSATDLNAGTLNDARLSTNVPLINANNIFTGINKFSGNLGVGITPTAALHLKAGTAAAGTAPLKLTAGTNLTTPEAGAIEFDGTSLYITDSTLVRHNLLAGGGAITLTGQVTGTGTGSIATSISTGAIGTAEIANGTVATIDLADDAITYAKMQNIATQTLIGRSTAGSGDPESLTLGAGLIITGGALNLTDTTDDDSFATLLGVCANGYAPYKTGGIWTCLEATAANTPSTLVMREADGDIVASVATLNGVKLNNAGSYVTITNPIGSNYNLTLPIDDGTASQVLQTDGAGVLSWVTPAISGDFLRDGSLDMTGTLKSVAGSAASPGLTFSGDTDNGIFAPSADTVAITTSGSERLRVAPSGNVGIGVTTPSYKLEVAGGDISTTGAYRIGADNAINWFSTNQNLGVGKLSMSSLTSGSNNTGLGALTLQLVTSGSSNTAAGRFALGQLTTGSGNTAVGTTAMYSAGSAQFNTAVGFNSAYYVNGAYNTAVGWNALGSGAFSGATAYNTTIGAQSGYSISGGTQNTFVGYQSGRDNTTGNSNIAIGYQANDTNTTGSGNIIIGNSVNTSSPGASNEINIGNVFRLDSTNGAAITAPSNVNIGLSAIGTGGVNISTVNGDISLYSGTGKVRIGQGAPPPFTAMGACTIAAFTGITGANTGKTCSGVPVGAAINCSPLAAPNAITWGAYVTSANTVTLNFSGGTGGSIAWACGWIVP